MRTVTMTALTLLASAWSQAYAARVDELFGEGAFGATWGATLDEVQDVHPDGETSSFGATNSGYSVRDSRTIFELERRRRDEISFLFTEGSLSGISVEFPDCADLMTKLYQFVGPIDVAPDNSDALEIGIVSMGTWQGETVSVTVVASPPTCSLNVAAAIEPVDASRAELGLE